MGVSKHKWLLLLVIILAALLRLYMLGDKSLSFDETFHPYLRISGEDFWGSIIGFSPYPPVWDIFTHWTTGLTLGEFWLRLPSVIFGTLTVLFVYLTINLIFDRKVALLSSFLTAISPLAVYVSQDLKPYSLLSFSFLLSFYFFINLLKSKKSIYWILFALTTAAAAYVHWYVLIYILILNLYIFIHKRKVLAKWLYLQALLFVLLSPLLYYAMTLPRINLGEMTAAAKLLTLPYILQGYALGEVSPYMVGYSINMALIPLLIPLILVIFYLFIKGAKSSRLLLYILLIPVILYAISFFLPLQIVPKRVSFAAFAFYAIIAKGLFSVRNKAKFNILLVILILSSFFSLVYFYQDDKENWRSASYFISNRFQEGDVIGFMSAQMRTTLVYNFHMASIDLPVKGIPYDTSFTDARLKTKPIDIPTKVTINNLKNIDAITNGHERLWLVQTREQSRYVDPDNLVKQYLDSNYKLISSKYYSKDAIKIYLYDLKEPQKPILPKKKGGC